MRPPTRWVLVVLVAFVAALVAYGFVDGYRHRSTLNAAECPPSEEGNRAAAEFLGAPYPYDWEADHMADRINALTLEQLDYLTDLQHHYEVLAAESCRAWSCRGGWALLNRLGDWLYGVTHSTDVLTCYP